MGTPKPRWLDNANTRDAAWKLAGEHADRLRDLLGVDDLTGLFSVGVRPLPRDASGTCFQVLLYDERT